MYDFLVVLQIIGVFISCGVVAFIVSEKPSKPQQYLLLAGLASLLDGIGYYNELTAKSEEAAILAIKIEYIGLITMVPLMFLFMARCCDYEMSKIVRSFVFAFPPAFLFFCNSTG